MLEKNNGPLVVLVVKDDPLIRISAATFIEDAGFLALEAANADQAMALLEDKRHDIRVLFTDIDMPGSMNGPLLALAVHDRWPPIRIVVTSAHRFVTENHLSAGGVFLPKPYDALRVGQTLRRMAAA